MVSSPLAVSPADTTVFPNAGRSLVHLSLLFVVLIGAAARAQETRYFRIGTAATGGSFFEIGGIVAGAISSPVDAPACEHGGSCGVRGLVAVAQATPGSIENLKLINDGQIESGFAPGRSGRLGVQRYRRFRRLWTDAAAASNCQPVSRSGAPRRP